MLKLNVQQNSNANILMPASVATDMYATVWSTAFNAVVVHGGNTTTPDIMNLFHPGNNSWTSLPIIGADIPSPRSYHCMVEAHGGTKIVLFGGTRYTGNSGYFDIYIFDVATRTWKRGADSDVGYKRSSAACAMAGDIFITWGGDSRRPNETQTPVPPVLLYNIVTDSWLTQFSPPGDSPGLGP
ncbi:hypothetical protein BGZ73_003517 [Actinomortierella ambigua]|nr:hypothetical protein BGZ73_003517 [Actinomortierella ambigua]